MNNCRSSVLFFLMLFPGIFPYFRMSGQAFIHPEPSFPPRVEAFVLPGGNLGNRVHDITQDSVGFLWFTSSYGLHRYDGYEVRTFLHDPNDTTTIPSHYPYCLYVARDGSLWAGFWNQLAGLARYDYPTEAFMRFRHEAPEAESLTHAFITVITEDTHGYLWVGTYNRGLYRIDRETGAVRRFSHEPADPKSLSFNRVSSLLVDSQGTLWVGTGLGRFTGNDGGLNRYDPITESFTRYDHQPGNPHSLLNNKIDALLEDSRGNFWVGTRGDGLHLMDRETGTFQRHVLDLSDISGLTLPYLLTTNAVNFLYEDLERRLWVSTYLGGVRCYDPPSGHLTVFATDAKEPQRLNSQLNMTIFQSGDGTLWLGPGEDFNPVVHRIDWKHQDFTYYPVGNKVQSLVDTREGHTWIGTLDSGLIRLNRETNEIKRYRLGAEGPDAVLSDDIYDLYEDKEGLLWIGFKFNKEFNSLDPVTGVHRRYTFFPDTPDPAGVLMTDFEEDPAGRIWVATFREGIFILDKTTGAVSRFQPPASPRDSFPLKNVTRLFVDRQGRMWIGCGGARFEQQQDLTISCLDFNSDSIRHFRLETPFTDLRTYINGIEEDQEGHLWISTFQTLFRLDPVSGELRSFHHRNDPAFQAAAFSMIKDKTGKLWISGVDGFTCFDPVSERVTSFRPSRLSHNFIVFEMAGHCNDEGEIFFGDNLGFHAFSPEQALAETLRFPPSVKLTEFRLAGAPLKVTTGSPLQNSIWESRSITLTHDQNAFTLRFSSLDYRNPSATRYEYILENYDDAWNWAGADPAASYSRVPPGEYRFRVKALSDEGLWSKEASLAIRITPPWWATGWAYGTYATVIIGLIFFFINLQFKRRLAVAEARALRQLDLAKTRLYTNISHEFRTPITVIQGMARQVKENPEKWFRQGLDMITQNAGRLLLLVNQLLDLSKLEAGAMETQMKQGEVITFLRYLTEPFRWHAQTRNIELYFQTTEKELWMDFDAEKLTQICSNLLSNAVKFTTPGGRVEMKVEVSKPFPKLLGTPLPRASTEDFTDWLKLSVSDNGPGIPKDQQSRIFDRFYQVADEKTHAVPHGTGIGLALTRELVKLLDGQISVQSREGRGSVFTVLLPVRRTAPLSASPEKSSPHDIGSALSYSEISSGANTSIDAPGSDLPLALVVEDNADVVTLLQSFLSERYQITSAPDGAEGIRLAVELIPDIIVSDIMMPEKDGLELCDTLKQDARTCHIPIILLTARADQPSRLAGLQRGADAYLSKPFDQQELLIRMEKLIKGRQQLQRYYLAAAGFIVEPAAPEPAPALSPPDHTFVRQVRDLVTARLDDFDLQVQDLAKAVHLSPSQLYRKLKALTGLSTNHFIRSIRLQEARRLLKDPARSVTSVAFDTGFRHPDYFSKVFHDEFGMTPTEYREVPAG